MKKYWKMTTQEFRHLHSFDDYDVTPEWIIHHLIQHETEHRGQIMELRKCAERALRI
ncbi:MAG: DinB family protein [Candidatus Methanofastidiosia archaeon]